MTYDPFARGPLPVGVQSLEMTDTARQRTLPVEVWYPAAEPHRGQDLDAATRDHYELLPGFPPVWQEAVRDAAPRAGTHPLVMFSHGYGSHRRQTTFFCAHLASHGYIVAAMDHTGNTILDMMQFMLQVQGGARFDTEASLAEFIEARPADVVFVLDQLLGGALPALAPLIDRERIGVAGHSFGGWTTLTVCARDQRFRAALPLAPAGGWSTMPTQPLIDALDLAWGRPVPTLYLVAEKDTLLPLRGMREMFAKTAAPKRLVVLRNADHMHFCDRIEQVHEMFRMLPPPGAFEDIAKLVPPISELAAPEHAYLFVNGLGLAHMDAALKGDEAAAHLLARAGAVMAERGVAVDVVE